MPREGILSDIGHGALGLRSGIPGRSELFETSAYEKQTFLECRPVKTVSGWTLESGTTWRAPAGFVYLSVVLDVVWMRTSLGRLNRTETLIQTTLTQGSYFYDPDASAGSWTWDGGAFWDSTPVWDSDPVLYVNLPGGIDPSTIIVNAVLGIFIGNFAVPQPNLSRVDDLFDGSFEESGSRGDPFANWQEGLGTNLTVDGDTSDFKDGARSAKFIGTDTPNGQAATLDQEILSVAVPGKIRWWAGWYKTDERNPAGFDLKLSVGDATTGNWLQQDGRTYGAQTYYTLTPTHGVWRRAVFCFIQPPGAGDMTVSFKFENASGATATGFAWVDGWRCRRVFRFNDYYPWLPSDGLPTLQVARPDGYFGEWNIGLGSLRLLNHSGALNEVFTRFNWIGQEIVVRSGGRFPGLGGSEVLFDDLALSYVALPTKVERTEAEAVIPVRDQRELLKIELPLDSYGTHNYPGVEQRFNGRPIPLLYGICSILTPTQVDVVIGGSAAELPIYDVGSNARLDEGAPTVRVFVDEESAAKQLLARSVLLTSSEWNIESGTNNHGFRFTEYPGPIEIEVGVNDMLDVTVDGNVREVLLTPGLYRLEANGSTAFGFLPHVESKLDALPDLDFTVSVSAGEYKPRISYSGTTLDLLIDSGVNKHRSAWKTLGFTGKDDLTGALLYEADTPVYTAERVADFVTRLYNVHGEHDDPSGTYTGVADALIEKPGDIAYHLLRSIVGFDPSQFDLASLAAARLETESAAPCDVVVGALANGRPKGREAMATVISRLETGGKLDVLLKGTIWTFTPRDDATPSDIVDLYDRDFILDTFHDWLQDSDTYYVVRVLYGQDPSEGTWRKIQTNPGGGDFVPQTHGRWEAADFQTYLRNYSDALNRLSSLAAIAIAPIRHYGFKVRGKAFDVPPGGKLRNNRTKGMTDPNGVIEPRVIRILSKIDNAETHESDIIAMTDIG